MIDSSKSTCYNAPNLIIKGMEEKSTRRLYVTESPGR